MVSPKASLLSALNVLRAAAQAGNALSHPRPPADRTARGTCEKRTLPDRSTSRPMDDGPAARLHPQHATQCPQPSSAPVLLVTPSLPDSVHSLSRGTKPYRRPSAQAPCRNFVAPKLPLQC